MEEAANAVMRCVDQSARAKQIAWMRITQGEQFAALVEQMVRLQEGKKK